MEIGKFELKDFELRLLPYAEGDQLSFIERSGREISVQVVDDQLHWVRSEITFCEWACCEDRFETVQTRTLRFNSAESLLNVNFSLKGDDKTTFGTSLTVETPGAHWLNLYYDSLGISCDRYYQVECLDSVLVNGTIYHKAYRKMFEHHLSTAGVIPTSIIYHDLGLIQINYSNGVSYSRKE